MYDHVLLSTSADDGDNNNTGSSGSGFYCAVCDVSFSDSRTYAAHRASLRHKKKSGDYDADARVYKADAAVTAADVHALVERMRVELAVTPWHELRYTPPSPSPAHATDEQQQQQQGQEETRQETQRVDTAAATRPA